jgi:signal transduction histidine kinase
MIRAGLASHTNIIPLSKGFFNSLVSSSKKIVFQVRAKHQLARFFIKTNFGINPTADRLCHLIEFGQLASGTFHDLTNMLTATNLYLGLAQKEKRSHKNNNDLKLLLPIIERAGKHISLLRQQTNYRSENRIFCFNEEIAKNLEILRGKINKQGLVVRFCCSHNIKYYGNPAKFNRIFFNIMTNAIEAYELASRKNKKIIYINLAQKSEYITFSINDFGFGINPKNLKKIFQPLFTTKKHRGHTGLGLTSTRFIIEENFHGHIKVKSRLNKGTEFIVKIPVRQKNGLD